MIQSGIVTKQVTLAENIQLNIDFDEAVNLLYVYNVIDEKGIESLFDEAGIESLKKLNTVLSEAVEMYYAEFEDGKLKEEEEEYND